MRKMVSLYDYDTEHFLLRKNMQANSSVTITINIMITYYHFYGCLLIKNT